MLYYIIQYYILSYHILSYYILSYYIISNHIISYHIILYSVILYYIIWFYFISFYMYVYICIYIYILKHSVYTRLCLRHGKNSSLESATPQLWDTECLCSVSHGLAGWTIATQQETVIGMYFFVWGQIPSLWINIIINIGSSLKPNASTMNAGSWHYSCRLSSPSTCIFAASFAIFYSYTTVLRILRRLGTQHRAFWPWRSLPCRPAPRIMHFGSVE